MAVWCSDPLPTSFLSGSDTRSQVVAELVEANRAAAAFLDGLQLHHSATFMLHVRIKIPSKLKELSWTGRSPLGSASVLNGLAVAGPFPA